MNENIHAGTAGERAREPPRHHERAMPTFCSNLDFKKNTIYFSLRGKSRHADYSSTTNKGQGIIKELPAKRKIQPRALTHTPRRRQEKKKNEDGRRSSQHQEANSTAEDIPPKRDRQTAEVEPVEPTGVGLGLGIGLG